MDEWSFKNFAFIIKNNTNEIKNDIKDDIKIETKFSDKPSRPSLSLVDIELYKKLIASRNNAIKFKDYHKYSRITNPYEKVDKIIRTKFKSTDKKIDKNQLILYELIKFTEHYISVTDKTDVKNLIENDFFLNNLNLNEFTTIGNINVSMKEVDTSFDPDNQEQYNLKTIFSSITENFKNDHKIFICKIFDIITNPTYQLINILSLFYKEIIIIKPRTSNYHSSEKFIICIEPIDNIKIISELNLFNIQLSRWNLSNDHNLPYCREFKISPDIIHNDLTLENLMTFNNNLIKNQIKHIDATLKTVYLNDKQLSIIEAHQNKLASEYCQFFF